MSRIIVKNLPKDITETKLRKLFSQTGNITDVQLKYTSDGKFRQFAFIGYHDENEAAATIKSFNDTRINTNKIIVEVCSLLGDANKPKSWSKYAKDSTAYKQSHPEEILPSKKEKAKLEKSKTTLDILEKYKDDSEFAEFMKLHAPEDAKLLLDKPTDDDEEEEEEETSPQDEEPYKDASVKIAHQKISDSEYLKSLIKSNDGSELPIVKKLAKTEPKPPANITLFTAKIKNLPYNCKKKDIKDFFRKITPYSIRIPRNIEGIAFVGFKTESKLNKALLKDRTFIGGKRVFVMKYTKPDSASDNQNDPKKTKWKTQEEALKHEEDIAESGRIFIRNLSYTTTEDDIQELFSKYGTLTEVSLPVDSTTRKLKGFGVITFLIPEQAVQAYTELDGTILHGRMLHLLPGKAKEAPENEGENSTNYKKKKAQKEKAQAGFGHNWNSLFVGTNAVADVIAKTYGTTKDTILNSSSDDNAAVRLALGETQIVSNIKQYLEQEGVNLDAFNDAGCKRSKTIILVKNLPADTDVKQIRELFDKFGVIGRLIFPPNGLTAMVDFVEPSEARKAFMNLAYTKFKNLPLYLEWAPENCLTLPKVGQTPVTETSEKPAAEEEEPEKEAEEEEEEEEDEPEPDTTLYIKNLNFQTTDAELKNHFESCGKICYARVTTKRDPKNPQNTLSLGYGFVRFYHQASTNKALKNLQASTLNGKTLELKRSERTLQNEVTTTRTKSKLTKQTGTKILVRNVPFQAKASEITELFKAFGELKAVRIPKKMSGGEDSHRGFAFVDFVTASDAKRAFKALSQSTHLYGRRLVLEWAAAEEQVSDIRKRTAAHFHTDTEVKSKKSVAELNV